MSKLAWDITGEHLYETGVDHGVLYPITAGSYGKGVVWNGLTAVTESPSGAEANPIWADNIKYLNLLSAEDFGATVEAYTYPDEFAECDGSAEPTQGFKIGQQPRKAFGLCYRTIVGNDTEGNEHGYKLHIIYNALAAPSERAYSTINDSPEPATMSWELSTTAIPVGIKDATTGKEVYKPTSCITIDSTKTSAYKMKRIEDLLYGTDSSEAELPLPSTIYAIMISPDGGESSHPAG